MQPAVADGNRTGRAGGNHSGFCAGELCQLAAYAGLQLKHVDKVVRRIFESLPRRRYFQRAAKVGPGATRVDQRLDTNARIDVVGVGPLDRGCHSVRHGGGDAARANGGKQRSRSQQFQERSPVVQAILMLKFGYHISFLLHLKLKAPAEGGDSIWICDAG